MLLTREGETNSIARRGTLLYLTPSLEPFSNVPPELTAHFEEHMRELSTELSMSHVTTEESTVVTQDDPLEKLESLFGTIKPKYYHVDEWQLDEANYKLVRIHKRPRRRSCSWMSC